MTGKIRDLAEAVADGEAVDWAAVLSDDKETEVAANLRLLDRIASASGAKRRRGEESRRVRLSGVLTLWEAGLLLVAVLRSILVILGTLWLLPATGRDLLFAQLAVTASCLIAGLILVRGGEGDRRAVTLAGILLTTAGATSWPHYVRLLGQATGSSVDPLRFLLPEALFAYWVWAFVSVFPRRVVAGFGDQALVIGRRASLAWGILLLSAHALATVFPALRPSLLFLARTSTNFWFWGVVGLLTLAAFPAMILAARRAEPGEQRRAAYFLAAIVVGFGPLFLAIVADYVFGPLVLERFGPGLRLLPCLTFPFATAYGILVKRVVPVGVLLHQATRYLLVRATLGLVLGLPSLLVVLALMIQRDKPVAEALGGPVAGGIAAVGLVLAPVAIYRRQLLSRLDRLFNRDPQDWHAHVAHLTRSLGAAKTMQEALQGIEMSVAKPLGAESIDVFRMTPDQRSLGSTRSGLSPLPAGAGPALLAFDSSEPMLVDPADESSVFWWLPEVDRQWLIEVNAGLLAPLIVGEKPTGLLVVGPRRAGRSYEREELQFLGAACATTAAAIERFTFEPREILEVARECLACGLVFDREKGCACDSPLTEARLPRLLAGRYEIECCLGQGGMGKVYQAVDSDLGRAVALKTLPATSSEESIRLRQEARAMAGVVHPNLAVLYGIETWNGAPVLVEELMTGGTLADRLTEPMEIEDVVSLGIAMASALEALHAASFVHRDLKPSNIGYSNRDEPKLLDLGLAETAAGIPRRGPSREHGSPSQPSFAGTPRYAPPEAWRGEHVGAERDLWALAMVMYESITGHHPLAGIGPTAWTEAMTALPRPDVTRSDCPGWLSDLVLTGLSMKPGMRWRVAAEIHAALSNRL